MDARTWTLALLLAAGVGALPAQGGDIGVIIPPVSLPEPPPTPGSREQVSPLVARLRNPAGTVLGLELDLSTVNGNTPAPQAAEDAAQLLSALQVDDADGAKAAALGSWIVKRAARARGKPALFASVDGSVRWRDANGEGKPRSLDELFGDHSEPRKRDGKGGGKAKRSHHGGGRHKAAKDSDSDKGADASGGKRRHSDESGGDEAGGLGDSSSAARSAKRGWRDKADDLSGTSAEGRHARSRGPAVASAARRRAGSTAHGAASSAGGRPLRVVRPRSVFRGESGSSVAGRGGAKRAQAASGTQAAAKRRGGRPADAGASADAAGPRGARHSRTRASRGPDAPGLPDSDLRDVPNDGAASGSRGRMPRATPPGRSAASLADFLEPQPSARRSMGTEGPALAASKAAAPWAAPDSVAGAAAFSRARQLAAFRPSPEPPAKPASRSSRPVAPTDATLPLLGVLGAGLAALGLRRT